jgi:cytochrome oxidase assembly protein ShyY1
VGSFTATASSASRRAIGTKSDAAVPITVAPTTMVNRSAPAGANDHRRFTSGSLPSEVAVHAALRSPVVLLLKGRWLAGHVLVLLVAVTFVSLGFWQLARDREKQDEVRAREAAYAAPVVEGDGRIEALGTYDAGTQVLLRNQEHDGEDGFDVLTPLRTSDGSAVLVDRGWVSRADVAETPAPPSGDVIVRGEPRPSRPLDANDDVREIDGLLSVPRVGVDEVQRMVQYELSDTWIVAQYQDPAPADGDPQLPEPPSPDQVNHYQYALQWFALAAVPLIGWPIVCARTVRRRATP